MNLRKNAPTIVAVPQGLSAAQLVALAQNRPAVPSRPVRAIVAAPEAVAPVGSITPTDRARKAIELAVRHVGVDDALAIVSAMHLAAHPELIAPDEAPVEPKRTRKAKAAPAGE